MRFPAFGVLPLALGLLSLPAPAAGPDFEKAVAPVLLRRCLECHAGATPAGGLDLATQKALLAGGSSGPALVPGKPDDSPLLSWVARGEMPPKKQGPPLAAAEVQTLRGWIAAGAAWPEGRTLDAFEATTATRGGRDWWSFQPVRRPPVPALSDGRRAANPIDAFVQARLQARGWTAAPPADRRTLIRRATFDVLGLPPTYEEVEAFARDEAPDAYERLVDRLLASPHFGERWGRTWLDLVRYADTSGYERDQPKPGAWKYRDWVVAAVNADKPFDRFVTEQLAGDELPGRSLETLTGTGFLRLGTWNDEPNDPAEYTYERLEDLVGVTGTAFLGLTVRCARCHDHKFDPVRQVDYYRLAAAFWAGPVAPGPREWLGGPDPKLVGADVLAWTDKGPSPPPLHLLKKGDPARPGPVVEPGFLSLAPALDRPVPPPPPGATTTHRRRRLAAWITDPRNPLTARVWVNRLWQHHLGEGLVRSADNFGFTGERPTHPELLDWLAAELVANGWRSKPLHRLILLSDTYRQASIHPLQEEYARADASNRLWWRAERRRLDAEALHDALLAASGQLRRSCLGGPGYLPDVVPEALEGLSMKAAAWQASPPAEQQRRALYAFKKRGLLPPLLTTFDFPDTTLPCGRRDVTTVAPQALTMLNDPFLHDQGQSLASRLAAASADPGVQVRRAWQVVLARDPRPSELAAALDHLARVQGPGPDPHRRALESLCHVLLNTNEFLYVD